MKTVVFDTGPLIYLRLLDVVDVLPLMFGAIRIPGAVVRELTAIGNPRLASARAWASPPPPWVEIQEPRGIVPAFGDLHAGEAAAISLASEIGADLIVLDDAAARRAVVETRVGIGVVGTLGVLDAAAARGLLEDLPELLDRLLGETPFRCGSGCREIMAEMKRRDQERKRR